MLPAEKIAIVSALMHEDREEIRDNKGLLFNTSYFALSGIVAIAALALSREHYIDSFVIYMIGIWAFFALYITTFIHFWGHLRSLRQCLDIRERYFKELNHLENEDPFCPLKPIDHSIPPSITNKYLLFLPAVVLVVACLDTAVLIYVF